MSQHLKQYVTQDTQEDVTAYNHILILPIADLFVEVPGRDMIVYGISIVRRL